MTDTTLRYLLALKGAGYEHVRIDGGNSVSATPNCHIQGWPAYWVILEDMRLTSWVGEQLTIGEYDVRTLGCDEEYEGEAR